MLYDQIDCIRALKHSFYVTVSIFCLNCKDYVVCTDLSIVAEKLLLT